MGSLHFWAANATLEEVVGAAKADPSNDSVAMNEVVRRFEPKALELASGLTKDYHLQQDIANAARYGVVLAVRAHSSGTAGVAKYIALTMRGEALRAIGRNTEAREVVKDIDSPVWVGTRNLVEQTSVVESDLGLLVRDLTSEQRGLLFKRHIIGYSCTEIATSSGTSVSAISQRLKTIVKVVKVSAVQRGIS